MAEAQSGEGRNDCACVGTARVGLIDPNASMSNAKAARFMTFLLTNLRYGVFAGRLASNLMQIKIRTTAKLRTGFGRAGSV